MQDYLLMFLEFSITNQWENTLPAYVCPSLKPQSDLVGVSVEPATAKVIRKAVSSFQLEVSFSLIFPDCSWASDNLGCQNCVCPDSLETADGFLPKACLEPMW